MHNTLEAIAPQLLDTVSGGFPNGLPAPAKPPEPQTWTDRLDRNLLDRGYNGDIDRNMRTQPTDPNIDPGISKQWDPFAAPRVEGDA